MQPRGSFSSSARAALAAARDVLSSRVPELAAAAVAVVLYLPAIDFGFVFDDSSLIGADGSPVALGGALPYRPLRYASYAIDAWLGGSAAIYHAHNLLLHGLVAALVVALARRLGAWLPAALAAGLFVAVHPLSVEAAAYVSGRRDLLCVLLGLAALHAHLSGRLAVALGLFVAATAAKESALVFAAPLAAATLARLVAPRAADARRPLVPIVLASLAALALALAYGAVGPWAPAPGLAAWAMPGWVVAHYAASLFGLHALAPEYPALQEAASRLATGDAAAIVPGIAIGAVTAASAAWCFVACARAYLSDRACPTDRAARQFALAWTAAVVAALGIWGGLHEPGADRHAYLLLPPLAVLSALLLTGPNANNASSFRASRLWLPRERFALVPLTAAAVVLAASAVTARSQMQVWRSERSLWSHALLHAPASPRVHANLARVRAGEGDWRGATSHMNAALDADPRDPLLHVARASVRCAQGRTSLVRRDLRRALERGAEPAIVQALSKDCGVRPQDAGRRS